MNDTTSLYVESLLLEIQLDESNELITVMKKRWPHLNEIEPPSGAELAEAKAEPKPKIKRPREQQKVKYKYDTLFLISYFSRPIRRRDRKDHESQNQLIQLQLTKKPLRIVRKTMMVPVQN